MKKDLTIIYAWLSIICCLAPVTMMGHQINPSKTRMNNILLIDHGLKWPDGCNNLKELFYLKDLSFDDIQKSNIIIEETEYDNKFGNYVLSDSKKTFYIVRQVDSDCIYVHNVLCFKSKPDSLVYARLNKEGSNICRDDFHTSYIFLKQTLDGKKGWHCYTLEGSQRDFFDMDIDLQGRITNVLGDRVTYSLDNNILKISDNYGYYNFKWNKSYLTSHEIFEAVVGKKMSGEEDIYHSHYAKIEETEGNRWKTIILYRHEDNKMVPKFRVTRRILSTLDTPSDLYKDPDFPLPELEDDISFQEDDSDLEDVLPFQKEDSDVDSIPFNIVETKPQFYGGGISKFSQWIQDHLIYPETAEKDGIQGRVTLQFNVNADGSVNDVKVLRGVAPALDKEAVRVVSMSPKWEPGKQHGRAVIVTCTVSALFTTR